MIELPTESEPVRIVQGDCLDVLRELPDGCIDAVVTDPPFGARRPSAWRTADERFAEVEGNDAVRGEWLADAFRCTADGGAMYLFTCWDRMDEWRNLATAAGFRVRSCIVWDKGIHGLGDLETCWAPQHELILFSAKGRHELRGSRPKDIIRVQRVNANELLHPYQKPVKLIRELLRASVDYGDTILDPFAGSGTAGAAAVQQDCKAILIEKEPAYCEIARRRVAEAMGTGLLAGIA